MQNYNFYKQAIKAIISTSGSNYINEIAHFIVEEKRKEARLCHIIYQIIIGLLMCILLASCAEISDDEVIDNNLPKEYNTTSTYKPNDNVIHP
jgi:hypothetical protein